MFVTGLRLNLSLYKDLSAPEYHRKIYGFIRREFIIELKEAKRGKEAADDFKSYVDNFLNWINAVVHTDNIPDLNRGEWGFFFQSSSLLFYFPILTLTNGQLTVPIMFVDL